MARNYSAFVGFPNVGNTIYFRLASFGAFQLEEHPDEFAFKRADWRES
jgi:hypothetical protein